MKNTSLKKVFCPVLRGEIDGYDCFDAALVFEGVSPLSELPEKYRSQTKIKKYVWNANITRNKKTAEGAYSSAKKIFLIFI